MEHKLRSTSEGSELQRAEISDFIKIHSFLIFTVDSGQEWP